MKLIDYMRSLDPTYGNQKHQRDFIARMDRAQELNPCTLDHSGDDPPTHVTRCYPIRRGLMVCA